MTEETQATRERRERTMYCEHIADLLAVPDGRDNPPTPAFVADWKGASIAIAALSEQEEAEAWATYAKGYAMTGTESIVIQLPDKMDHSGLKHRYVAIVTCGDMACPGCTNQSFMEEMESKKEEREWQEHAARQREANSANLRN